MEKTPNATVVSVFPLEIVEQKPGLNPIEFIVPAAADKDFSILYVGICNNAVYIDADRGVMQVPEMGSVVAAAIVRDFCNAQLEFRSGVAEPGMFWVPNKPTKAEIATQFADKILAARQRQNKWFEMLVRLADTSWNKRKNHSEISELQRMAALKLGLSGKREWLIEYASV